MRSLERALILCASNITTKKISVTHIHPLPHSLWTPTVVILIFVYQMWFEFNKRTKDKRNKLNVPKRVSHCKLSCFNSHAKSHQPKNKKQLGVLEHRIHSDPWDPFLNRAKRVPSILNHFPKFTRKKKQIVSFTTTFKTH